MSSSAHTVATASPHSAIRFTGVRRRWSPRPGRTVRPNPASGTSVFSIPRRLPTRCTDDGPSTTPRPTSALATARPGRTWPAVPPPEMRTPPLTEVPGTPTAEPDGVDLPTGQGHLVWRAMLSSTPKAAMVTTSALPPKDTNGSGTPVMGNTPRTAPMFTKACTTTQQVTPAASS